MQQNGHSREVFHLQRKASAPRKSVGLDLLFAGALLFAAVFSVLAGIDAGLFSVTHVARTPEARVLEHTLGQLSQKSWDEVVAMQGDVRTLASTDPGARYRVDLAVKQASLDLLEIQASLYDTQIGKEVDRLVTFRSKPASGHR